ncbi:FCD domain-containing protein [Brooklawnia cerclae]|uniref:DNA-binding GntR family transcriptional regulator n=1 Tax=Brooklawnia cerclae TaxID=349934 RepID=A0ABX0SIZ7_9ACTN|nr:GntR family transcriptional regulator [Brooklawnia cerclae]NIH58363.1 DNA-binding GntR family transcriptional regulator [Brooklawnia cerclae]
MLDEELESFSDQTADDHPLGLAGQVYDSLVGLILQGQLTPRQPLRIHALARRLGVSATPVREALVRASAIGIVTRENNKGFRVAPRPSAAELDDLFVARIALEAQTARLASTRVDDSLIEHLEEALDYQRRCGEESTFESFTGFLNGDRVFHAHIAEAARNRFLSTALDMLGSHVQRYRSFNETVVTDRDETLAEHRAIIDAIRDQNPLAAEAAMTLHLANLRMRVRRERIGEEPEQPSR